ncbi:MAG: hypothetical protein JWM27_3971 [Gemmatimonadetes bacterium]|nr:hypothetical protein [Gemmatimonadota bacterium]
MDRGTAWVARMALAVATVSLALNGWLLWKLRHPESLLMPLLDRASALATGDETLRYRVRIPAGTPLHFDVPFDQTYRVRVDTHLPIDTHVTLPVRTPVGSWSVAVPVRTDVPIHLDLPVHLKDTFRLRTATQTELTIPLEVRLRDLPLGALRRSLNP